MEFDESLTLKLYLWAYVFASALMMFVATGLFLGLRMYRGESVSFGLIAGMIVATVASIVFGAVLSRVDARYLRQWRDTYGW